MKLDIKSRIYEYYVMLAQRLLKFKQGLLIF